MHEDDKAYFMRRAAEESAAAARAASLDLARIHKMLADQLRQLAERPDAPESEPEPATVSDRP